MSGYFVRDMDVPWEKTTTLEEWVIKMIEDKRTEDPAFQSALAFFGRPKFEGIWKAYQERKKETKSP